MSTSSYNDIYNEYLESRKLPYWKMTFDPTINKLFGDVTGKHVMDLACGEGTYTRRLMELGAADALGVDISPVMIGLAEEIEAKEPRGCRYLVSDVATLGKQGDFDMITAVFLMNYAKTPEELAAFLHHVCLNLNDGGIFTGLNDNPVVNPGPEDENYARFGLLKNTDKNKKDGDYLYYTFLLPSGPAELHIPYLSANTYAAAFAAAGFRHFSWEPLVMSDDATTEERECWQYFLDAPPVIGFRAIK